MNDYPKISEGIMGEQDTVKSNTELFLALVGQYFPEAIKDGEVDFNALKEEMGEFAEVSAEHYDFTWAGKQAAKKEAQTDLFGKTLRYKPQDSLNPDNTENIYIEGDNLEAMKLLRCNYHGKIKMIYIDITVTDMIQSILQYSLIFKLFYLARPRKSYFFLFSNKVCFAMVQNLTKSI